MSVRERRRRCERSTSVVAHFQDRGARSRAQVGSLESGRFRADRSSAPEHRTARRDRPGPRSCWGDESKPLRSGGVARSVGDRDPRPVGQGGRGAREAPNCGVSPALPRPNSKPGRAIRSESYGKGGQGPRNRRGVSKVDGASLTHCRGAIQFRSRASVGAVREGYFPPDCGPVRSLFGAGLSSGRGPSDRGHSHCSSSCSTADFPCCPMSHDTHVFHCVVTVRLSQCSASIEGLLGSLGEVSCSESACENGPSRSHFLPEVRIEETQFDL